MCLLSEAWVGQQCSCARTSRPRTALPPTQVCERTAADKKGGHLCRRKSDGKFLLRESAMCPDGDKPHFEDIALHKWVLWEGGGGFFDPPLNEQEHWAR